MCRARAALAVSVCLIAAAWSGAQEQQHQMSPEEKAAMEMWTKMATPGEGHAKLEPLVGSWTATVSSWGAPDGPRATSEGSAESSWILGGRFVEQHFKAEFMGMPFEGMGIVGYDNYRREYRNAWVDNFGTSMLMLTGSADGSGRIFTFNGEMDDFTTGRETPFRQVVRVVDANKHVMEMYGQGKDGKEFKMMEVVYTRK